MSVEDIEAHLGKAAPDECLVTAIGAQSGDWVVVLRFYVALHILQSYLITKDIRFEAKRHGDRLKAIRNSPELRRNFEDAYRRLQDVSEQVRYDPGYNARALDLKQSASDLQTVHTFLDNKIARYVASQRAQNAG
jgi:uncharacterized membrane-anchored protein YjiN (DUF445 family)